MAFKWLPVFDLDQCSGCGACATYCVSESIYFVDGMVKFKNPEACLSDGLCVHECPNDGIRMEWVEFKGKNRNGTVVDRKPV